MLASTLCRTSDTGKSRDLGRDGRLRVPVPPGLHDVVANQADSSGVAVWWVVQLADQIDGLNAQLAHHRGAVGWVVEPVLALQLLRRHARFRVGFQLAYVGQRVRLRAGPGAAMVRIVVRGQRVNVPACVGTPGCESVPSSHMSQVSVTP